MRTTFTREIDVFDSPDTILTQQPPENGEEQVTKWPVKVKYRNKVFAKVYLMLSGSWYKDAGKTGKAIQFTLKALFTYPGVFIMLVNKGFGMLFTNNKK